MKKLKIFIVTLNIFFFSFFIINTVNAESSINESNEINTSSTTNAEISTLENDIIKNKSISNEKKSVENNISSNVTPNNEIQNDILQNNNIETNNLNITNNENKSKAAANSVPAVPIGVMYDTHIQYEGWEDKYSKKDGATSGSTGKGFRLEAIHINLYGSESQNIKIKYQVHVQYQGWQDWKENGEMAGTSGQGLRLEGIKIKLESSDNYTVQYRVHVQYIGWQDWKTDGELAGTTGQGLRLEAIQIRIIQKVKKATMCIDTPGNNEILYAPSTINVFGWKMANISNTKIKAYIDNTEIQNIKYGKREDVINAIEGYGTSTENTNPGYSFSINGTSLSTGVHIIKVEVLTQKNEKLIEQTIKINIDRSLHVKYQTHVQYEGWQSSKIDGELSGTTGKGFRLEAIDISLLNAPSNAKIKYRTHVQYQGWQNWKENGEMAGTSGKGLRLEAIEIVLDNMDKYTVEYQVHIQNVGWTDWYRDGETAGTIGRGLRLEAIRIKIVNKKPKRQYKGLDVSSFNGIVNWGQVKQSNIDFAFLRVGFRGYGSKGTLNPDSKFIANITQTNKLGIPTGVYFVTQATTEAEAIEEANWVINQIKNYKISYPVAIDIEAAGLERPTDIPRTQNLDKNKRTYLASLFCKTIQNAGYTPIVYTNINWATNYLNMSELSNYDTWIASYKKDITSGPGYNGSYTIWQYTSQGSITGILRNVDLNICYKKY